MKNLCPNCQIIGPLNPWPCNVAWHRGLTAVQQWPRHLVETDWLSRASA